MDFSTEEMDEFIAIYERNYHEPISRAAAIDMARRLVNMYRMFLRPLPPLGHEVEAGEQSIPSELQAS